MNKMELNIKKLNFENRLNKIVKKLFSEDILLINKSTTDIDGKFQK